MSDGRNHETGQIGTLNEKSLHAALKRWYARPHDLFEVPLDGYVIDIVRDEQLVEIQTRNFSAIRHKMHALTSCHPVTLVYPIAQEQWIVRLDSDGHSRQSRRKSPKRGAVEQVFRELVSFPRLLRRPNFSLHVLLIQEEEVRRRAGRRGWRRRGWVTQERHLVQVVGERMFKTPRDLAALVPRSLEEPFTTSELASAIAKPRWLAQKMAYCLREMEAVRTVGKRGNAYLYARSD